MGLMPTVAHGRPVQTAKNIVSWGDTKRSWLVDSVPLFIGIAVLYDKAFIAGNPDSSWSFTDIVLVYMVAWFIMRTGVVRRWS